MMNIEEQLLEGIAGTEKKVAKKPAVAAANIDPDAPIADLYSLTPANAPDTVYVQTNDTLVSFPTAPGGANVELRVGDRVKFHSSYLPSVERYKPGTLIRLNTLDAVYAESRNIRRRERLTTAEDVSVVFAKAKTSGKDIPRGRPVVTAGPSESPDQRALRLAKERVGGNSASAVH
jgi:hypothetical protein